MLPEQKLNALLARHKGIEHELSNQLAPETYVRLSREFAELNPVVDAVKAYRDVVAEIDGLDALLNDAATDAEMRQMAAAEKPSLEQKRVELEKEIKLALLPKDAMDERNVIIEIRAGTGGDEASLFAGDLFRMYEQFAAKQGWKVELVSASEGSMGGYKEIIAEISRPRRLRQAQIRKRRAPRPARARRPRLRPHPHLDRDGRGAARSRKRSTSPSTSPTSRSTRCAPAAPAASTSTRPSRRCASPTSRPASR